MALLETDPYEERHRGRKGTIRGQHPKAPGYVFVHWDGNKIEAGYPIAKKRLRVVETCMCNGGRGWCARCYGT